MVSLEADGRASSTRAVVDLLCLNNAGGGANSRFISAIRWTWFNSGPEWTSGGNSSAGIWGRVVCSRIVEDVWTICRFGWPEGWSIDGRDVSRTASGRRIAWSARVGWQWRTIKRRRTFSCPV